MPILSNTPTIRYITIQNLVIKDSNVYYPVVTTETSKKYIYWDKESPYELICEDEMLEDRANLYLLVLNKKGNFTIVNQNSISVNFNEDVNLDEFDNKLNATIEKVDEHTKKFMSVTEDINGINKTVGTITEDLNETNEKLTNYKQTADQIAIDLQNTNKKYNDDKEFNQLRENIISLLIDENSLLMRLNSSIKDITRDNNFTEEEKTEIKDTQSEITNKNDLLIIEVEKLVSMLEKEGLTDKKNQLTSIKEEYSNSFNLLNSTLTLLISGNLITPTQITTLINCISSVSTKLTKLKNICDEIIFLGTGGTLYEEIVKINITAGGIYSKISSIEENIKSNLSLEKGILNQHVKDLQTAVDKIETIAKEIYIDGLVNQNEKDLISQNLQSIENEHNDLIGKYNEYLSNEYLSQEMKTKLQSIYSDYINSYNTFVNELNTVISDGFFNESEKTNVDLKLEDYRKNIIILHNNLSLTIDDYEQNRYKSEIEAQKNQLQDEINKVQQDIVDLTDNIEGTFKDNIIDESERNSIKQNIKNLNIQKANIDSQYSQLYKNSLLLDPLKSQFTKVYNDFNSSYDILLATLNEILNKDTLITQQDKINMDRCYADLVLKTTEYTTVVNQVVEFIANAEAEQSKASFKDEIEDLQQQIDGIDLSIDGTFADNILDKTERELIKSKLETINANKIDIDSQYNKLYNSPDLKDNNLKVQFKEKYDAFIIGYNNFTSIGNTLLKKEGIITEEEKKQLNNAISSVNTLLGEFTSCSLNVTESIYNTQTQNKISDINGDINDLTNRMDNVVTTVADALTDGILDKAEKTSIEQGLLNLQSQKVEIDNEYNQLYTNVNLDTQSKSQLKGSYDTFILKYNKLIDSINVMLTKEDIITEIERNNYTTAYEDYKSYLATFTQSLYEANNKIYNKITENAKGELSKEIGKVSQSVSDLSGLMNGAFYDGVLSEAEKIALKSNLDLLKVEKVDVDNQYKQTYNNSNLSSSNKLSLKTTYDNYIIAYNALVKFIETLIVSTDKVNDSHKTQLDTLLKTHNDKLALYVVQYNLAIENISKSYTDTTKNALQQQINGVSDSILDLEKDMNGVFQDSVLTEAEKLAIKERLQNLQVEKVNIDNQYNTLINNVDLVDKDAINTPKTNLKNAYNNLVSAYTTLVNAINTLLNTNGILDDSHRKPVNDAFTNYKNKLGVYSTKVNEAIDAISKKRVDDEANTRKEQYSEVNRTVSEISTKVASVEQTVNTVNEKVTEVSQTVDGLKTTVSDVKTTADGALSKASTVEQTVKGLKSEVGEVNTVANNALEKATVAQQTAEGFNRTITENLNNNYYKRTEIDETIDGLEIKISESGGYNLLYNGDFKRGLDQWRIINAGAGTTNDLSSPTKYGIYHIGELNKTRVVDQAVSYKNSKLPVTLSFWRNTSSDGVDGTTDCFRGVQILLLHDDETKTYHQIDNQVVFGKWEKASITVTPTKPTKEIWVKIYNRDSSKIVYYSSMMLEYGKIANNWSPNPNEVSDGIVTIDKDGVTVEASNIKSITSMSADGFKITKTDTNQDVFKVNNDGLLSLIGEITTQTGGSKSGYLGNNSVRFYNWLSAAKEEIAWLYAGITTNGENLRGASLRGLEYLGIGLKGTGDYGENYIVVKDGVVKIQKELNMSSYGIQGLRYINYPTALAVYMNNLWFHLNQLNTNNSLGYLDFNYSIGPNTTAASAITKVSNGKNTGEYGELRCGDFKTYGTKNAYVQTSIGYLGINAYETAECYFGDIGETILDDDGYSYVYIDSIFKETISNTHNYQVFLSVYGEGVANVIERTVNYFVIKGTPKLEVGYEIKGKRKGYEDYRLQREYNSYVKGQEHGLDYDYKLERDEFDKQLEETTSNFTLNSEELIDTVDNNIQTCLKNKELINLINERIEEYENIN